MKQKSISESLLFAALFVIAVLVLPVFRIASAIEFGHSNTDTISLPYGQLDNFAIAQFKSSTGYKAATGVVSTIAVVNSWQYWV